MLSPDTHGVFLPSSYRHTFHQCDVASMETVKVPIAVTPSRLSVYAVATLILLTLLFMSIALLLLLCTSIALLAIVGFGALFYSSLCAAVLKMFMRLSAHNEKHLDLTMQFCLLDEDTMNYLQAVKTKRV